MLLHINGKFTMGKLISSLLSISVVLTLPPSVNVEVKVKVLSIPICICGILYFKLNGIDAMKEITKHRII
jgi:hypothetical protein